MEIDNHSDRILEQKSSYGNSPSSVTSLWFELNEILLAVGYGDGMIRVYDTSNDILEGEFNKVNQTVWNYDPMETKFPITNMVWMLRHGQSKKDLYWTRTLLTSTGDGHVRGWDLNSKERKPLFDIDQTKHGGTYGLDIHNETKMLATGGSDYVLWIYDLNDEPYKVCASLKHSHENEPAHFNRIFSCKFDQNEPNIVYSGGWDKIVSMFDLRADWPICHISGPYISGDTLDYKNGLLLCGSYWIEDCLEIYDIRKM